jgi:hypothetical protein
MVNIYYGWDGSSDLDLAEKFLSGGGWSIIASGRQAATEIMVDRGCFGISPLVRCPRYFVTKPRAKMSLGTADTSVRATWWRTLQRAASALVPTGGGFEITGTAY